MKQFEILSKTDSRPFRLGDDISVVVKGLGEPDRVVNANGGRGPSEYFYWETLDFRLLVAKNKVIAFEFYNKPEGPFSLKILGKPYRHTLASVRALQDAVHSTGHTLLSNGGGYRIERLHIVFDFVKYEGQVVSLIYCDADYAKLYDAFDYQPCEI